MNEDIFDKLFNVVTSLLNHPLDRVVIGRENATQQTFTNDYIVIDELASTPVSYGRAYDSDAEQETHENLMNGTFTLEFYGENARANAMKFVNLQYSQEFLELQRTNGVIIFKTPVGNNRKQVFGNQYYERYELEIVVQYIEETTISRLRISEIPTEFTISN